MSRAQSRRVRITSECSFGAGAVVTSWDGGDPVKAGNIIAAAPKLHAEVMRTLRD